MMEMEDRIRISIDDFRDSKYLKQFIEYYIDKYATIQGETEDGDIVIINIADENIDVEVTHKHKLIRHMMFWLDGTVEDLKI